jgi:hypothetical protein
MNKIYILLTSLLLLGCDWGLGPDYNPTSETKYVDYYKEACDSTSTDMCFRIRSNTEDDFALSTVLNSGFDDLEWGKRYTLKVEVEYNSSGDDSSYTLQSIENEVAVDAATNSFDLDFSMASQILLDNLNSSWIIAGEDIFSCIESDCILLTNSYNANEKIRLKFSATDDQLTLIEVVCSAAENDFASDCEGLNKTNWDIAHFQSDCGSFEPKLCLVYRESEISDDAWHILPFEIVDFTASWGTQYGIQVETVSSGGSIRSAQYSQENSNDDLSEDDFNVVMRTGVQGLQKSNSGVISYDDVEFNCAINNQCDLIDDAIDNADETSERLIALLTSIKTVNEQTIFVIQSLTCDESSDDFNEDCVDLEEGVIWDKLP